MYKILLIILLAATFCALYFWPKDEKNEYLKVTVNDIQFYLEIADENNERKEGLMYRENLCDRCGMLFIFDQKEFQGIWMRNMKIDIDVFWLDSNGVVIEMFDNMKAEKDAKQSDELALFVVELASDTVEKYNIGIGDQFIW